MVSTAFEEQHSHRPEIEVDKVLGLVGYIGPKVPAHDAVPGGGVLGIELFLDVSSHILLDREFVQALLRRYDGVLLHLFAHVT